MLPVFDNAPTGSDTCAHTGRTATRPDRRVNGREMAVAKPAHAEVLTTLNPDSIACPIKFLCVERDHLHAHTCSHHTRVKASETDCQCRPVRLSMPALTCRHTALAGTQVRHLVEEHDVKVMHELDQHAKSLVLSIISIQQICSAEVQPGGEQTPAQARDVPCGADSASSTRHDIKEASFDHTRNSQSVAGASQHLLEARPTHMSSASMRHVEGKN